MKSMDFLTGGAMDWRKLRFGKWLAAVGLSLVVGTSSSQVNAEPLLRGVYANTRSLDSYGWAEHREGDSYGQTSQTTIGGTRLFGNDGFVSQVNGQLLVSNEGNVAGTAGWYNRTLWNESTIVGAGLFWDLTQSPYDNTFQQVSFATELVKFGWLPQTPVVVRPSFTLPVGSTVQSTGIAGGGLSDGLTIRDTVVGFGGEYRVHEAALTTIDVEASVLPKEGQFELFAAWYYMDANVGEQGHGVRGGMRAYLSDSIRADVAVSGDEVFGTNVSGGLAWFFGGDGGNQPDSVGRLLRRRYERNGQVAINRVNVPFGPAFTQITDQNTGDGINAFFVAEGATGAGTQDDPSNINAVLADADFGAGSAMILLDENGNLTDQIILNDPRQQVVGGGDTGNAFINFSIATGDPANVLALMDLGGRPVLATGGADGVILTDGSVASGFTIDGADNAIVAGPMVFSAMIDDLVITDSTTSGLFFTATPAMSQLEVTNTSIANGTGTGINIATSSQGTFTFDDVDITNTGDTSLTISGGDADVTFDANSSITQANNVSTVNINGGHSGDFDFAGTINASGGDGLQFADADGTYDFTGASTLNGGDAGIDILGNSAGTFTFGALTSIVDPTGDAFVVNGDDTNSPTVTYSGTIQNDDNRAIRVENTVGGNLITFNSAAADAIQDSGTGVFIEDVDQTVNFTAEMELIGTQGVQIIDSDGVFTFTDTDINLTGTESPSVLVNGGDADVSFLATSSMTQSQNESTVEVTNGHSGDFDFAGMIAATNGDGLQFDDADGTYDFTGTTALNGGDAGIDLLGGSNGTFTFGTNTSIVNPTGVAFNVDGDTGDVTYSGSISQSNNAAAVMIANHSSGGASPITFDTNSTIAATNGTGLQFDNADRVYNFNGTVTLNGGDAGIDILNFSGGTFNFGENVSITNPTGIAFNIVNSQGTNGFFNGTISQSNDASSFVFDSAPGANFTFGNTSVITHTGEATAIRVNNVGGPLLSFNGSITASTGSATAIDLTNTGIITFGNQLDIDTTTGIGFNATGVGTVNVLSTAADQSIVSTSGQAINLDGITAGMSFDRISSTNSGANAAIDINNLGAGSTFTVDDGSAGTTNDVVINGTNAGVAGIEITNTQGTFTFSSVDIDNIGGHGIELSNNGASTIDILGGTIDGTTNDGINVANSNVSVDGVTFGGTTQIGDDGIEVVNAVDQTVAIDNAVITDAAGTGIFVDGSGGGTTTVTSLESNTVTEAGAGGILFDTVTFDANTTMGGIQQVDGGDTDIGGGVGQRVEGDGLSLVDVTGDLAFTTLDIFNNAGTGLEVIGASAAPFTTFNLVNGGGSINTTAGVAMFLDPLTTDLTFDTVTADGGTSGIIVDTIAASGGVGTNALTIGTLNVSNTTGDSVVLVDNGAGNFNIGTTGGAMITDATGDGIELDGNSMMTAITFGDTTINLGATAGTAGINYVNSNGETTFGDVTITDVGNAANQVGIDFNGATLSGNAAYNSVAISGPDTSTTSIGVDLTGLMGDQTVNLGAQADPATGPDSSITDLHRGVVIDDTAAVQFTFGDGEDMADIGAMINVNGQEDAFTVDAGNGTLAASSFDFSDVMFGVGDDANFPAAANSAIFVSTSGGMVAMGTNGLSQAVNTISVTDALILVDPNAVFAFVGDAGGQIDVTAGGATGFALDVGQSIDGFNNGNSVSFGQTQPMNVTGNFGIVGGTVTANSAVAQNSNGAATSVITAGGNNTIENNIIDGTGTTTSLIDVSAAATAVTLNGLDLQNIQAGGGGINLDGNTAAVTLTDVDLIGMGNAGTALQIDATTASTAQVTADAASDIDGTTGTVVSIGAGARDINLSAVTIDAMNNTDNVIDVTGQTGGTIMFGDVDIAGFNDGTGTAVNLQGTGGNVSFTDLDVATTAGAGVNVGAITFAPGATPTINAAGANALIMNGTTLSGGAATFASVTSSGGATGIDLDNVSGTTTFTTVDIDGSTADGIDLDNAGTVVINGGDIDDTAGDGIDSTNTALTVNNIDIGQNNFIDVIDGIGIDVNNTDATNRVVTLMNTDVTANLDAVTVTKSGAGNLDLDLSGNTLLTFGDAGAVIDGSVGTGTLFITGLNGNEVNGAFTGGLIVESATFDADTSTMAIDAVAGGNTTIGDIAMTTDVIGDGLRLNNVLGSIGFGTLNIGNDNGTGLFIRDDAGKGGSFAFSNTGGTINTTNGSAMDIDPVAMNSTFASVSSTNANGQGSGGTSAILLDTISGTVNIMGGSLTGATGPTYNELNSTANVTYGGTITQNNAANVVNIDNKTGGTTTFSGLVTGTTTTATSVDLTNNAGGTITFNGGLDIDTTTGDGLYANNAGTVNITGNGNSIDTADGRGIYLEDTTAGMTFNQITVLENSAGGDAITLREMSGSFEVTGTTSVGSAGTVGNGISITSGTTEQMGTIAFGDVSLGADGTGGTGRAISVDGSNQTISFSNTSISGNWGAGTDVRYRGIGSAGSLWFDELNNTGTTTGRGLAIQNSAGNVTVNSGTIAGQASNALDVENGTGAVTIFADVIDLSGGGNVVSISGRSLTSQTINIMGDVTGAGGGILVDNNTGGTINFTGDITMSGEKGLYVDNNSGTTVNFSGPDTVFNNRLDAVTLINNAATTSVGFNSGNLNIDSNLGSGINATGAGSLSILGNGNTIDAYNDDAIVLDGIVFTLNNTWVGNGGAFFTIDTANSTLSGSGNIAPSFNSNDGGGNSGVIEFNGGLDFAP